VSVSVSGLAALDADFMPDTCILARTTPGAVNLDGSGTDGTVTTATVPCRLVVGASVERLLAGRLAQEADAVLSVPLGTDVRVTDTVTASGTTYQIIDTSAGATYATSIMLTLKLVQ
jgi:hypothetical protein